MRWQKIIIYFTFSLFIVSCGKKKEPTQDQTPAATPPPAVPAASDQTTPAKESAKAKPATVKPADSTGKQDKASRVGTPKPGTPKPGTSQKKEDSSKNDKVASKSTPKVSQDSVKSKPTTKAIEKTTGKSAIKSTAARPSGPLVPLTGGVSASGLYFTGASNDGALQTLISKEGSLSSEQQEIDKALAIQIFNSSYLVDRTHQLSVDVVLKSSSTTENLRFQMPFQFNQIMVVDQGPYRLSAMCVDKKLFSDECFNLLVTLDKGSAQAQILLRQSRAVLGWDAEIDSDLEYSTLVQFLKNGNLDYETPNKLDRVYFNTYEVINGKSGYVAILTGKNNQVIALNSDLVINKNMSAPLNSVSLLTDSEDLNLFMVDSSSDLTFMSMIKSATLVQNNGKGEIAIEMKVVSPGTKVTNNLKLTFRRILIPVSL